MNLKQIINAFLLQFLLILYTCQVSPQITLQYTDDDALDSQATVFSDYQISNLFLNNYPKFSCANQNIFTYNQTQQQFFNNSAYNMSFANFAGNFQVQIKSMYKIVTPQPALTRCFQACIIVVSNNCQQQTDTDLIIVTVSDEQNKNGLNFVYNIICDVQKLSNPVQWGKIILTVISTPIIFISSKFQQAKAYKNRAHYVNLYTVTVYCLLILLSAVLIIITVPGTTQAISYIGLIISIIYGTIGIAVCCGELMYWLNIKYFRYGFAIKDFQFRIMDLIGYVIAITVVVSWLLNGFNWIIGDLIYIFVFIATIKLIKFGSLKIAVIAFSSAMTIDILFIILSWFTNGIYYNNAMLSIFNNSLFLVCPTISHYPNRRCSWYFLFSMAYPGILQCYFYRYDSSRSSKVYSYIFLVCYIVTLGGWIFVNIQTAFTLPYDLIVIPLTIIVVVLYANRRGQIDQIWQGKFYDQMHKDHNQNTKQVKESVQVQLRQSQIKYKKELFQGLKVEEASQNHSFSERNSDLSHPINQEYNLQIKLEQIHSAKESQ